MEDNDQTNKKHMVAKTGRKAREDNKIKVDACDKKIHKDSRGFGLVKTKRKIDKVNQKAFAIQNVAKAKKKVAMIVDRRTSSHTYQTFSDATLNCPHLIALMGPSGSGKSTLMRTMMRHYTGQRKKIEGPVTVVSSKRKRVTLLEVKNDLAAMIDAVKVADTILILINVKQGLQTETFELIEALNAHGATRLKIIYTHIDEYPRFDKVAIKRMKEITKRLQTEINAKTFNLTECKKMRNDNNSEYKLQDVINLTRLIGQKNPLPNAWRDNHPYVLVDRIERNELLSDSKVDCLKFYGFVRGCKMSLDIKKMHLMGVDDLSINSVTVLSDPCPTPQQEAATNVKRQPLAMKERKAYAPMSGYGGVLKDADGFHIVSQNDNLNREESDEEENNVPVKSSLIQDVSDSDEDDSEENEDEEDGPPSKKRLVESGASELIEEFDALQSEMNINNTAINYERLVYDDDYTCQNDPSEQNVELHNDLFVSGKWGENEDASALLKKDDINRKKIMNANQGNASDEDDDSEMENEDDDSDMANEDDDSEVENEGDDSDMENEGDDIDMENEGDDSDTEDDEEECDIESNEDEDNEDDEVDIDNSDKDEDNDNKETWVADTANLTDFQKKRIERQSRTKRQKRLEKKEKQKALFDKLYDEKSGGDNSSAFFDKFKADHIDQVQKNKDAFKHIDPENVHKFAGVEPGSYVVIEIKDIPKEFFNRFKPSRAVILGGLAPGEESTAILTAKFSLHRHFNQASVIKHYDPLCLSIGWRRIQPYCHFFKEEHNLRKSFLKYSLGKGLFCDMAFEAPIVPVKTGFMATFNYLPNERFRVVGLGSIHSKNDSLEIMKKLKRVGVPIKVFKKTAIITDMFVDDLEVERYHDSRLKTTAGVRGAVKKSANESNYPPGSFRATFEAPISLSDRVTMTCFCPVTTLFKYQDVTDLINGDQFPYLVPFNQLHRDLNLPAPVKKPDSDYAVVERPIFNPGPILMSQKVIDQLPFVNRPPVPKPEDLVQNSRPKVVLSAKESQKVKLYGNLLLQESERRKKMLEAKSKYKVKKGKADKVIKAGKEKKEKEKRKRFFKKDSIKSGKATKPRKSET